jgi:hypothetical protein
LGNPILFRNDANSLGFSLKNTYKSYDMRSMNKVKYLSFSIFRFERVFHEIDELVEQ